MKKILIIMLTCAVMVLMGCPQANVGGGETPEPFVDYTSRTASIGMKAIEGGTFARDNDGTGGETNTTDITVSNFYLGETEVTQAQWLAVMTEWPGKDEETPTDSGVFKVPSDVYGLGANYPAYYISWYDAVEFCNALSEDEGLNEYYTIDKANKDNNNSNKNDTLKWTVTINKEANGYRLPTEAEWEYAAGGGDSSNRTIYAAKITSDDTTVGVDDTTGALLTDYAWYNINANGTAHIVGTAGSAESPLIAKSGNSNALGLYDMSGNVWEWCWDWHDDYDKTLTDNPTGATSGSDRGDRGGSWLTGPSFLHVANRYPYNPSGRTYTDGFRVARNAN